MDPNMFPDLPSKRQRLRDIQDKETGDLFAAPAPAVNSPTSKASAEAIDINARAKRMLQVHNVITASGMEGLARFEVADQIDIDVNWITSSVKRLLELGQIVELKRTHYNAKSQRDCAVLIDKRFLHQQPDCAA